MLYDISARILYEYESTATAGRHLLRLLPLDIPGVQRVVASTLSVEPDPVEWINRRDFFGNLAVELAFTEPHKETAFRVQARVERYDAGQGLDMSPPPYGLAREISAYAGGLAPEAPHHFLATSPRVTPDHAITGYARQAIAEAVTTYGAVISLGEALHRDMSFDPDATSVETSPQEAFEARHGVCQDFSHIMIAGLRGLGIPAGYVSGFLRTRPPEGKPRLEGADAMHAWVRAWCGLELGWIEYDPTNAITVGSDHITVAYGRDYFDVAPVKGITRIWGDQDTHHSVDVIPLGD